MRFPYDGLMFNIQSSILEDVVSYIIQPHLMSSLCAVSRLWEEICWRESTWTGSLVDTLSWKPRGGASYYHDVLWGFTAGVVTRSWMWECSDFLKFSKFKPWKWTASSPSLPIFPSRPQVRFDDSMWRCHSGCWLLFGSRIPTSNIKLMIDPVYDYHLMTGDFSICITTIKNVRKIISYILNEDIPVDFDQISSLMTNTTLDVFGVTIRSGEASFHWNSTTVSRVTMANKSVAYMSGKVLTFVVTINKMALHTSSGSLFQTTFGGLPQAHGTYYPVFVYIPVSKNDRPNVQYLPVIVPFVCDKDSDAIMKRIGTYSADQITS